MEGFWVYGVNPVREALRAGVPAGKLLLARQKGVGEILELAERRGVRVEVVRRSELSSLLSGIPHQGVALWLEDFPYADLEDVLQGEGEPFIVVLDGIEDPRNFGAIVRTAEASGVWGVIIPKRRAVGVTGVVAKASAGAVFHLPIARVSNIAQAMRKLKQKGIWFIGAEAGAGESIYDLDLRGPLALVIGSEGKGIRPLVRRECDFLVSIPMKGRINSLNASVAAAVLMYEVLRQREFSNPGH